MGTKDGYPADEKIQRLTAVHDERAFLQATLDALSAQIAVLDSDGRILFVNEAWRRFAIANGRDPRVDDVGAIYVDACRTGLPHAPEDDLAAAIGEVIAGRRDEFRYEYPCHSPTQQRWFVMHVRPFAEPAPRRLTVAHEDVTARKLAEASRQAAEGWLQIASSSLGVGLWLWDVLADRITYSPSWLDALGYAEAEVAPGLDGLLALVHPDDFERVVQAASGIRESGWHYETELRLRHRDGRYLWFLARCVVQPEGLGRAPRVAGASFEMTERKQAEIAARTARLWLDVAQKGSGVGLWDMDIRSGYTRYSESWREVLGYDPDRFNGDTLAFYELIHPDDMTGYMESVQAWVAGPKSEPWEHEFRVRRADGRYSWILSRGVLVRDELGQPSRMVGAHVNIDTRRASEEAARRNQYLMAEAERLGAMGGWLYDLTTGATQWSAGMFRMHGLEPASSPMPLGDPGHYLEPDDYSTLENRVSAWVADDSADDIITPSEHVHIIRADGARRSLHLSMRRSRDEQGKVTSLVGLCQDVTEREAAAAALRESEARLRLALEVANGGVWSSNLDTGESTWSEGSFRLLGYDPRTDLPSMAKWRARVHPDDAADVAEIVERLASGAQSGFAREYRIVLPDGRVRWIRDAGGVDATSGQRRFVGVMIDVTELKESERALARWNADLEAEVERRSVQLRQQAEAMDAAMEGIALLKDDAYVYVNPAHARMYGYARPEDLLGKSWRVLYDEAELARIEGEAIGTVQEKGVWMGALRGLRADGSSFDVEVGLSRTSHGDLVCVCRDISERSRLDAELRHSRDLLSATNDDLVRANHAKDDFLASMSHELRTPLAAVLGITEALLSNIYGEVTFAQAGMLRVIDESGRHLLDLINDLLDWSKLRAGRPVVEKEPVDLAALCEAALRMVRPAADAKHIQLRFVGESSPPSPCGDERRIKQVLVNLLSNAVKFTPDQGRVELAVRALAETRRLELSVEDSGIGIADADQSRVFEPFVRIDNPMVRQTLGTGLGLALSRRLAEALGGELRVRSQVGVGSCFTLSLPWDPDEEPKERGIPGQVREDPAAAPAATPPTTITTEGALLLVVEDNSANLRFLSDFLESLGYAVCAARDGREAIATAEERRPALIVMDVQMPEMDGLEATRRLRADGWKMPILLLTALAMPGDRERCLSAGASDYLSKPVSLRELGEAIRVQLAKGAV